MAKVFIGLGSNIGDRKNHIQKALERIRSLGPILALSSLYESVPWGNNEQTTFLNQVIKLETHLAPHDLLVKLQSIENDLGRMRKEKWGPRTIDLDILLYENEIVDNKNLKIPHPQMPNRNFVLVPLMEIAADQLHPTLHKTIEELYIDSRDECDIAIID